MMRNSLIPAGLLCLAAGAASAQQPPLISDGGDYRPMQVNMSEGTQVRQGAIDAARMSNGAGTESIGSSTAPLPVHGDGG